MWSTVVRRLAYPAHEALVRRSTFRFWRGLECSQWDSPVDLRATAARKLGDLFRHARDNIPFYRRRFEQAGLPDDPRDPSQALRDLPPLSKDEIRSSLGAMLWHSCPDGWFESNTGGSTGEPLTFYLDRRRQAFDQAARMRSHRWFGVQPGDRELYLWGSPIERQRRDTIKRLRDGFLNQRLLDAFNMSAATMDRYLDDWDRFRPVCLFGYPSSIARFVEHAAARKRRLSTSELRAVFVTGEVCLAEDRRLICEYFGVPVADGYGSRDAGFIAHQCPQGRMHVTAENVIVEILVEGRPAPPGGSGEIVVTHLDAYAMPLIRYRTGDIGRLVPGRCPCGRGLPLMDVVQGRVTDFLYLPDGNVRHALSIIYPLRELPGIRQFRVVQEPDFSIRVEVVCDDRAARITADAVARRVRPVMGDGIHIGVDLVDEIAPSASGKHRYVISHAKPATANTRGGEVQRV